MYFVDLFPVPALDDGDVDAMLERALDADVTDTERVVALHRLRGTSPERRVHVARKLVAILNEPLHWVPCEALMAIDALAPRLAIGVDGNGVLRASPTDSADLVDDGCALHCPALGRVATAREVDVVCERELPWLARRPARCVVSIDGRRRAIALGSEIAVAGDVKLRFRHTADVVALSTSGGFRINGAALASGVLVSRVGVGDDVEVGDVRARVVLVGTGAAPLGTIDVRIHGDYRGVELAHAIAFGGGHLVGVGARVLGVVDGLHATRISWDGLAMPSERNRRHLAATERFDVFGHVAEGRQRPLITFELRAT